MSLYIPYSGLTNNRTDFRLSLQLYKIISITGNSIQFQSYKQLYTLLSMHFPKQIVRGFSTMYRNIHGRCLFPILECDVEQKTISTILKPQNHFITLKDNEIDFLIEQDDEMLDRYFSYLKYYCSLAGSTDATAEQILETLNYSACSNANKQRLSFFNKLLSDRGFLYIKKTRDKQGHIRNTYYMAEKWTPTLINQPNIKNILTLFKKDFIEEYRFVGLPKYRFDFFVNNSYIIEYDGKQHFFPIKVFGGEEQTYTIHKNDLLKNKYCFEHNIPIIRIPYDANYTEEDLFLETTRFLLTPENEAEYYSQRSNQ